MSRLTLGSILVAALAANFAPAPLGQCEGEVTAGAEISSEITCEPDCAAGCATFLVSIPGLPEQGAVCGCSDASAPTSCTAALYPAGSSGVPVAYGRCPVGYECQVELEIINTDPLEFSGTGICVEI